MFEIPAALLSWFYGLTNNYVFAIGCIAAVVMAITTPLTLKSTKGMLEMQRLAPELRKIQNEHRNDKQKSQEEMMKLYQEHKVNPMASCLPIAAQMPIFLIMFRVLRGLVYKPIGGDGGDATRNVAAATLRAIGAADTDQGFIPRYLATDSALYTSLFDRTSMPSLGLELDLSAIDAVSESIGKGFIYVLLVVVLGALYYGQQKMVAARATISPTMSVGQQKLMQYLPVFFAVFQIFFLSALVVYYIFQTLFRILQQYYITKKFYGGDESLGRQAQRAGEQAREDAKNNGESTGFLAQAKRELGGGGGKDAAPKNDTDGKGASKNGAKGGGKGGGGKGAETNGKAPREITSKRVTPPKNRPTPSSPTKGRPTPSRKEAQAARASRANRPKSPKKRR